ncbi:UDP-glucuronic acid/UDP-N-acetylgalactosamine transporter [Morella rubra]|uniref:UDP-glucuronic acid/UDP-N-acetylgalactosamine transporter n=1 Tax=Morella rubra TaxID=262757 RepID=A0A6A1UWE9_9ROSI|nr:UDP-glucuronic acid/UDP-N-acetylgalactosamine transporter [Morella rubra]
MTRRGAYAAISYMSCAVLLILFNKAALSSYNFPSANVITLSQIICSCCFLYAMRRSKIISFTVGESPRVSDNATTLVPLKTLRHTLPLSGAYLLYMLVTMESVRGVNVPMYTTLRRTTVVFTMVVEYILAGQKYTSSIVGSVGLIVLGAFVAGARDFSFDGYGYAVVFLANITTAIYLATIARVGSTTTLKNYFAFGKSSGLNSFGLMWCNGRLAVPDLNLPSISSFPAKLRVICGPFLLFWTFIRGDLEMTINFPYLFSPGFLAVLLCSCILAFFLNYSIFLNTTLNSALTQTICGNLKFNVIGQLLGFLGSGLYAYYKLVGK